MAKFNLPSVLKIGSDDDIELDARSTQVNKQLHIIGLIISIMMFVVSLILLVMAVIKIYSINSDFKSNNVSYTTADNVNQLVASVLLLFITSMAGLIFLRLYQAKPPFSRGNIFVIRVVAVMLMLLSVLPILFQVIVAGFYGISIKMSINFMYIFIGIIFYCISYMFEHGEIVQKRMSETVDQQENVLLNVAEAAEAKSGTFGQHIKRVSEYTRVMAKNLGMNDDEVENIRIASMLHDIGNILIPSEILQKESSLNDEEFAIMKTHIVAGEQLLQNAEGNIMEMARQIALEHHEHWNGTGYLGKTGKEISLPARIVAVADSFDMLIISAKGYKSGWDPNKAYHSICDDSGRKFDPEVIKVFIQCYKELLDIYKKYNKAGSKDTVLSDNIISEYDQILGEYSPRNKPKEEEAVTAASKTYQDVELDLRRLI